MQTRYERCPNCMQQLSGPVDRCEQCGFDIANYVERNTCLKPFTVLQNKYMIGRVIGVGGFGITYIGWDLNLQTYIAIKEYFPESFASRDTSVSAENTIVSPNEDKKEIYDKGLKRYVEEAQNLSKFYRLEGIVSVKDFFYDNGTAYIVMEYINGINLKEFLKNSGGRLDEATVLTLMKPVLESLYQIHNAGLIHRDISPDNIMVDGDGKIKLIDFGSARGNAAETDKTYTVILKHGYAPSEQYYAKGNQGPWTDIYSICATMYKMLTGQVPPNSIERMDNDEYKNPSAWGVNVSQRTEMVLAKGLAVKASDRYQNIYDLLTDLYGTAPIDMNANRMPTNAPSGFGNSAGVQSMHLSMQSGQNKEPKKANGRKAIIITAVAVLAVIAIIVIAVVLGKPKDEGKTTTTTEDGIDDKTTEDKPDPDTAEPAPSTDEPEVQPSGYEYKWPTSLSSNWRDYQISIDGTVVQFPIPYSEWKTMGWKSDYLPTNISAGDSQYVLFYNDNMEVDVMITNFKSTEVDITDTFIIGISIDGSFNEVSDKAAIELPGGIKFGVSSIEDAKLAFGAPEYIYEGEDYTSLDYAGDTYEDGMELKFSTDNVLISITLGTTARPEGLPDDSADIPIEAPDFNNDYTAPETGSTDRFDNIITLDGINYRLPAPVSEFTKNGWILDTATDPYIGGASNTVTYLEKGGNKIEVTIANRTKDAMFPANGLVERILVDEMYCSYEVIFPGGIKVGDSDSVIDEIYGDMPEDDISIYESEYNKSVYIYNWDDYEGLISIHCYSD
ncbi:MAG: serine/threonine protein kinase, partial [Wujia sp.]